MRVPAVLRDVTLPVWAALSLVLAAAVVAKVGFGVPWHHTLGDPATTTGWPFYVGFASNVGAVMWAAMAGIFLFRYHMHRALGGEPRWGRFLLASGLFTALLGLDDLFLLHDQVFPDYLGVSQVIVVGAYGALGILYLLRFAPQIARTAWPVFAVAIVLLASSVVLDQMMDRLSIYLPGSGFLEDAFKLMGIGTWLSYAVHTCAMPPAYLRSTTVPPYR